MGSEKMSSKKDPKPTDSWGNTLPEYQTNEPIPPPSKPDGFYDYEPHPTSKFAVIKVSAIIIDWIVMSIPLIGWIIAVVWALDVFSTRNQRNLARAFLVLLLISAVLFTVAIGEKWITVPPLQGIVQDWVDGNMQSGGTTPIPSGM